MNWFVTIRWANFLPYGKVLVICYLDWRIMLHRFDHAKVLKLSVNIKERLHKS